MSLIALGLFFFSLIIWYYQSRRQSRHGAVSAGYPVLGNTLEFIRNRERILDWTTERLAQAPANTLNMKRVGYKPFRVTANPAVVEYMLRTNFDNYPKGGYVSAILGDLLGDGIFNADGELWKTQRKLASFEFTTNSLRDYIIESLTQEVEHRLLPTLESLSERGAEADLQDVFMRLAFDSVCQIAFGVDPKCLGPDFPVVKFAQAFDTATAMITQRVLYVHPCIWKAMKILNVGTEKKLKDALTVVDEFATTVIRNRKQELLNGEHQKDDLLSRFAAGNRFSDKFLRDIVISFVLAGKDTTSVTLSWFFWLLAKHPEVKDKIRQEVKKLVSSRSGSATSGSFFTLDELREMHYLHAALSESLRLYPAVPVDTKEAQHPDILPDGGRVETGTRTSYHVYAMGRMENLWGKDCREFKPERWIHDGKFVAESPYKFTAFQAGPRICLGKDMAMLQMKFVVAAVLRKFEIELVNPEEVPKYGFNMTLQMKDGLIVRSKRYGSD